MQFELHGFKSFDELLAFHCAPALTGIKPADLCQLPYCIYACSRAAFG